MLLRMELFHSEPTIFILHSGKYAEMSYEYSTKYCKLEWYSIDNVFSSFTWLFHEFVVCIDMINNRALNNRT